MDCFVLGIGGMMPMPHRNLSSVAVRIEGELYLFDCGEGTQVPYKELHLGLRTLGTILISHLHADHVLGLPGMMMLRGQMPDAGPLTLVGPPGLARFVRNVRRDLRMHIGYPVEVIEWSESSGDEAYVDERVRILWRPLAHSVFCLGYRIEEHERPGRFDLEAARALGVPPGPLYGELQQGQPVTTPSGTEVRPEQVLGPRRRGRHVALITDTTPTPALQPLMRDVDIAFVESMFLPEDAAEASAKSHMTAEQSARAAQQAGARKLVLMHISPRYENRDIKRFAEAAREVHPDACVAREKQQFTIPLQD